MNSQAITLQNVFSGTSIANKAIQERIISEILAKRTPLFTTLLHDKRAKCVFIVSYYGPGSDYLYSNDFKTNDEVYDYIELIYDTLGAITKDQAFMLEREVRRFKNWNNL